MYIYALIDNYYFLEKILFFIFKNSCNDNGQVVELLTLILCFVYLHRQTANPGTFGEALRRFVQPSILRRSR